MIYLDLEPEERRFVSSVLFENGWSEEEIVECDDERFTVAVEAIRVGRNRSREKSNEILHRYLSQLENLKLWTVSQLTEDPERAEEIMKITEENVALLDEGIRREFGSTDEVDDG
jgi:hypothetical protein